MRINPCNARRLGLALALTGGTLAAAAPAALAAPAVAVSPATDLAQSGQEITVRGTGFAAPDVPSGVYVGLTAEVDGEIAFTTAAFSWVRTTSITDGAFETRFTVSRNVTLSKADSTTADVDCARVVCSITTWPQHTNPRSDTRYTTTPIGFATGATVTVAPKSDLSRTGETTLTISGSGFDPAFNANGFYVAYGKQPTAFPVSATDAELLPVQKWVSPMTPEGAQTARLNADGTFSTTLTISPTWTTRGATPTDVNCAFQIYAQCGVYTWAAHGANRFRGFDTRTQVTFTPLTPKLEASPTTNLNRDAATTVTLRGSDFSSGVYAGLVAVVGDRVLTGPQTSFRWLRANGPTPADTISETGGFTTTLDITPTFQSETTAIDCRVTACVLATWRQHSNPTPATLLTSTPVTFAAAVIPPPERRIDPVPTVVAPKATSVKKAQKVGKNGVATVGTIAIGSQDATLKPYKLTLKIGKKRYAATVVVPKSVKAGKKATVKVKLSKKAIAALKGRSLKVTVKVKVTAGGKATTVSTKATLKGAAVKKKAAAKK